MPETSKLRCVALAAVLIGGSGFIEPPKMREVFINYLSTLHSEGFKARLLTSLQELRDVRTRTAFVDCMLRRSITWVERILESPETNSLSERTAREMIKLRWSIDADTCHG